MKNNLKITLSIIICLAFSIFASGCASSGQFHRDEAGVLKAETRSEQGVHKPDSPQ